MTINGNNLIKNPRYLKLVFEAWQKIVLICKEEGRGMLVKAGELENN